MRYRSVLPDINRLSIVLAAIMLAFALTMVVSFPDRSVAFNFLGIELSFSIDFQTLVILLTGFLAAAGMEWLIQSHPGERQKTTGGRSFQHLILPILTTLVIGVALSNFEAGVYWWVIFGLGSLLLMGVLIAEYNVSDIEVADQYPLAKVGLTGLSFALYLLLTVAVYAADLRLYLRVPILAIGALGVINRSLYLRLGEFYPVWSLVNSIIVSEVAIGLHYLPTAPILFGLILVGLAYGLTATVSGIKESRTGWALWGEPVGMLLILILIGLIWP
ncbi:MAG: hypothetical protein SVR81_00365 [Chloroflexota bacterium]|nr:hypothetical protein [Chloroflexota bacterium]